MCLPLGSVRSFNLYTFVGYTQPLVIVAASDNWGESALVPREPWRQLFLYEGRL